MPHNSNSGGFLPLHGGYRNLLSYQKSEIIYDGTIYFTKRFYKKFDRTIDQMVQAARSGKQNIVEASMASGTSKEMEIKLKSDLLASAASQIPEEFILYADTAQFTYEEIAQTDTTNNATTLNYRGTMTGLLLNRKSLDERLAQETITKASAGEVQTTNLEELSVSFADPKTTVSESATSFDLKITGDAQYLWNVKKDEIAHDLAGKPKNSLGTVLSSHPAIEKAKVTLHPFWKRSFPNNASKIEILTGTQ